jgi:hypothetical protein
VANSWKTTCATSVAESPRKLRAGSMGASSRPSSSLRFHFPLSSFAQRKPTDPFGIRGAAALPSHTRSFHSAFSTCA